MSLKVVLKQGERIHIAFGALEVDTGHISTLWINGEIPFLREKDFLPEENATTNARRVYLIIQQAYLHRDPERLSAEYPAIALSLLTTDPQTAQFVAAINAELVERDLYRALKAARRLVQFDEGVLHSITETAQWFGFGPAEHSQNRWQFRKAG